MVRLWRGILGIIFNAPADHGLSADDIAERLYSSAAELRQLELDYGLKPAQMVIYAIHDMAAAGLLDKGMILSAFIRPQGRNSARKLLARVCDLETHFLKLLQEEAPDAEAGGWMDLDISRANQRLQNAGDESNPVTLRNLLKGLAYDGTGMAGSHGSIDLKHMGRHRCCVARLSQEGFRTWGSRLASVVEARIVGMLQWYADDGQPEYHRYAKVASWEVPLV